MNAVDPIKDPESNLELNSSVQTEETQLRDSDDQSLHSSDTIELGNHPEK